jgi:hypothetical protein
MPEAFNIMTYVSPSGRFELEVDPSEFSGVGPGDCVLKNNGSVIWKARLPFTFHEAQVLDDGTVAGYGYAVGETRGDPAAGMARAMLQIAIFSPNGTQRLDKVFAGDGDDVKGISLDRERFSIFMGNEGLCRSYRISNGEELNIMIPPMPLVEGEGEVDCSLLAAVRIAETPLTLLHWLVEDRQQTLTDYGSIFTLIDSTGAQVWELIALRDYTNPDKTIEQRIKWAVQENGAVFKTEKAGTFDLWLAKKEQRVRYEVHQKDGQWSVAELSSKTHALAPLVQKKSVAIEAPSLEKLGSLLLEAPPLTGPVMDISSFGFDGRGRIGFLRERGHFVLVGQNGDLIAEIPLQLPQDLPGDAKVFLTWIAGNRWLVTASLWDEDTKARAWWIDAAKKTMTEIAGFKCLRIDSLAGAGDGGFVVLSHALMNGITTELVAAFDAAGEKRWSIAANQKFTAECFFSPDSVTVTSNGEVAVLDQARQTVHLYDLGGKHLRTVELEKEWKSKNTAARDITADADGGFIVRKLGEPLFVRMTAEGRVRAELATKFKEGGVPAYYGEIRIDPDGRMWQNNRHNFVRLGDDGVVDRLVGTKADEDTLGVIAGAAAGATGLIYLADDQTGSVHVFSPEGRKLHIFKPTKTDTSGNLRSPTLTVTDKGRVFLKGDWIDEKYMVFCADGSPENAIPTEQFFNWIARRGIGGMLMTGFRELMITDESLAVKRTINRWPDRRWFEYCESAAVAEDGSFVILGGSGPEVGLLGFYSPDGNPQRMARVPVEWDTERLSLAGWNRKHIAMNYGSISVICDREGKLVNSQNVPAIEGKWAQFIMRDGQELWILDFEKREVSRYAMPTID